MGVGADNDSEQNKSEHKRSHHQLGMTNPWPQLHSFTYPTPAARHRWHGLTESPHEGPACSAHSLTNRIQLLCRQALGHVHGRWQWHLMECSCADFYTVVRKGSWLLGITEWSLFLAKCCCLQRATTQLVSQLSHVCNQKRRQVQRKQLRTD